MGRKRYTQEKFLEMARTFHGDKYDYSKTTYLDMHTKIVVICPLHGEFEVEPRNHLKSGCKKCQSVKPSMSFSQFKQRSDKIHNNLFQYDETTWQGLKNKLKIICPVHGEFWQLASNHLNGFGCKKDGCRNRKI